MQTYNRVLSLLCLVSMGSFFPSCSKDDVKEEVPVPDRKYEYNILDYGADNTGVANCDKSFLKLIQSIGESRYAEIVIPAGQYKISKRIVIDSKIFDGYKLSHGIVIKGAGVDVTEIICDNAEGGIFIDVGTNLISVSIKDITFVAPKDNCGVAVEFGTKGQNPGDHHSRMFHMTNVLIRGERWDKGFFNKGVKCQNAWYPMLENVQITNKYGEKSQITKMDYGILFEDCYSPTVVECYCWGAAESGLRYIGKNIKPEDGIVDNSYFVGQDNGIYVNLTTSSWSEPALHISNSHINYRRNGVYIDGCRQVFITGNLFYCSERGGSYYLKDETPVCSYTPVDLNLEKSSDAIVSYNQFTEPGSPKRIAVRISAKSANIMISNNIFNLDATAVVNESSKSSVCKGNVFGGTPDFTAGKLIRYRDETGTLEVD